MSRINLGSGLVGTMSWLWGLSITLSGQAAVGLGQATELVGIAGVAAATLLLLWLAMPETSARLPTISQGND